MSALARFSGFVEKVNALARQHTAAAIEALVKLLGDRRTRVQAVQALLDRGWGKPMQAVELATPDIVMAHRFGEALDGEGRRQPGMARLEGRATTPVANQAHHRPSIIKRSAFFVAPTRDEILRRLLHLGSEYCTCLH